MNLFSTEFVLLLCTTLLIYYLVPKKYQWLPLLGASLIFYVFSGPKNLIFIFTTSVTTWYAGLKMSEISDAFQKCKKREGITKEERKALKEHMNRKKWRILIVTLLLNFGILSYLKYFETVINSFVLIPERGNEPFSLGLLLPLGISFYTFQSAGYLIDQYKEVYPSEKNYFKYLLFVSYFPQMIQGPINRFDKLYGELFKGYSFCWEEIKRALFRILFGSMKKFAIANLLADAIVVILDSPVADTPGSVIVAGILMYSAQQYADFSGGIDIVLGISGLFGISMMENFRQPYFATSLADFWRRWHISLGAWMRDYVFYPFALTGKMQKFGKWGVARFGRETGRVLPACVGNILVFFIVGLWHGAKLHFILWGLYNGLVIAISDLLAPQFKKWKESLKVKEESKGYYLFCVIRTFIIVNIGWYFDRITNPRDCILCFRNTVFNFKAGEFVANMTSLMESVLTKKEILFVGVAVILVFIHSMIAEKKKDGFDILQKCPIPIRWGVYYLMLILIQFSMGLGGKTESFMYAAF